MISDWFAYIPRSMSPPTAPSTSFRSPATQINMLVSTDGGDTLYNVATPPATGITTATDALPATEPVSAVFPAARSASLTDPTACVVRSRGQ